MKTLQEQQEKAWRLAPDVTTGVEQDADGSWFALNVFNHSRRWLYRGVIGDWDRRDTLQTRQEREDMNKAENGNPATGDIPRWTPEIGQECEMLDGFARWVKVTVAACMDGYIIGWDAEHKRVFYSNDLSEFRPIQSKADKERENQIEALRKALAVVSEIIYIYPETIQEAESLHQQNVRVLKPGESIGRRLSYEEIQGMFTELSQLDAAEKTLNAIFGESDDE